MSVATIGRPTDCTEANTELMAAKLREVGCIETAVAQMPFTGRAHYGWMRRGRNDEEPFVHYFQAVNRARAIWVETNVIEPATRLAKGDMNNPQYTLQLASMMRPDLYSPKSKAFEFRAMIEAMQRMGVEVTEEGAMRLAAHILEVDPAELSMRSDGTVETADKRKRLSMKFLQEIEE